MKTATTEKPQKKPHTHTTPQKIAHAHVPTTYEI